MKIITEQEAIAILKVNRPVTGDALLAHFADPEIAWTLIHGVKVLSGYPEPTIPTQVAAMFEAGVPDAHVAALLNCPTDAAN